MHAHINKCSVKCGLMPVKDPYESFFFPQLTFFLGGFFFFLMKCTVVYEERVNNVENCNN